ncbi:MAG: hypothetical protein OHK0022_48910 [Roseiflexaceae bacterium]
MPTHVVYIDDSGTKEYAASPDLYSNSGCSRYFVFGGVCVSTVEAGKLSTNIREIKNRYFGTDNVEIKSNWLRIPKEQEKRYLKPYNLTTDVLKEFVDEYYQSIQDADLCLIASVVDKIHVQDQYPRPWYAPAIAYELLLQRVVQECAAPNSVSVIIDDMTGATPKGNQYKQNLISHHRNLRQRGSTLYRGVDFSSLTGDVKFVNSAFSPLVQVADVISYNIYRQFVQYGEKWEEEGLEELPTYEWFNKLGPKFRQGPGRRIQGFGVVKFPLRKRIKWRYTE